MYTQCIRLKKVEQNKAKQMYLKDNTAIEIENGGFY